MLWITYEMNSTSFIHMLCTDGEEPRAMCAGLLENLDQAATTFSVNFAVTSGCSFTTTSCLPVALMCALGSTTMRLSTTGPPEALRAPATSQR